MSSSARAVFLSIALVSVFCGPAPEEPADLPEPTPVAGAVAVAELAPTEGSDVTGTVVFREVNGRVQVVATVKGLTPGQRHGFHIHEFGDCSAPDSSSAGAHFDPTGHAHGAPGIGEHHAGDLGNIEADSEGNGHLDMLVDFITLDESPISALNRAVVVHQDEDDLVTQPTGDAGAPLACGVIRLQ